LRAAVSGFLTNWDSIVAEILALRSPATTIVRTMDVYNPFVGIDKAAGRFALLDQYLEPINAHIAQSAVRNQIPFAKVHQVFNGTAGDEDPIAKGYISLDGVHPNDNGHKIIADLLRSLGYAPLNQ
jgi:lysophospholipase L1-like esterase